MYLSSSTKNHRGVYHTIIEERLLLLLLHVHAVSISAKLLAVSWNEGFERLSIVVKSLNC